jgi:hypothetical protein
MRRVIAPAVTILGLTVLGPASCGSDLTLELRRAESSGSIGADAGSGADAAGSENGGSDGSVIQGGQNGGGAAGAPPVDVCPSCAACESADDCADNSTEVLCSPTTQLCVACLKDADCRGGRLCDAVVSACAATCSSDLECGDRLCNTDIGLCVECLTENDCGADAPHCIHDCVECVGDEDCPSAHPYCLAQRHRCVDCLSDRDCLEPEALCTPSHSCRVFPVDGP